MNRDTIFLKNLGLKFILAPHSLYALEMKQKHRMILEDFLSGALQLPGTFTDTFLFVFVLLFLFV